MPGTSKRDLTASQAKAILGSRRPRDLAGKTRKRLALEQLDELLAIDTKIKASAKELKAMVFATGSKLMDLPGIGPIDAARILADVGDVTRFADRNRFASWTGTALLDASSGEQIRHRLSRAGNRKMNHMLHMAATTQIRLDTEGRAYYRRKRAAGKTHLEALRCLKQRISDAVYRQLLADAQAAEQPADVGVEKEAMSTGPGGQRGASVKSSAVDLPPHIDTSNQRSEYCSSYTVDAPPPPPAASRRRAEAHPAKTCSMPSTQRCHVRTRVVRLRD